MKISSGVIAILIINYACVQRNKVVIEGHKKIVAEIDADGQFNGLVRAYNESTGVLISEIEYKHGVKNGQQKYYYNNGRISVEDSIVMGKINGFVTFYTLNGKIEKKEFYYYGLLVGPRISFNSVGGVKAYWFYSLDGECLMYLNYDSLNSQPLSKRVDRVIFARSSKSYAITTEGDGKMEKEYFIYKPSPPGYNFRYELVLTDSNYSKVEVIKALNEDGIWEEFLLPTRDTVKEQSYAIRLRFFDPVYGDEAFGYKFLKQIESN
jgi:antitoxin component YwqK of YwqJK toxin-antitoxin module